MEKEDVKPEEILNINVGILGHIDSGKTSLAKAISTLHSTASFDKSPQSKERGITLDLGFSAFTVDIPEHFIGKVPERFKKVQFTLVDCFADDHELLTNQGFMGMDELKRALEKKNGLLVAGYDHTNAQIIYENPLQFIQHEPKQQTMIEFTDRDEALRWSDCSDSYGDDHYSRKNQVSNGVSLIVTPGHDMFAKKTVKGDKEGQINCDFEKIQARDLLPSDVDHTVKFLSQAEEGARLDEQLPFIEKLGLLNDEQSKAFLSIYGFWLHDGSLKFATSDEGNDVIMFSQLKTKDIEFLHQKLASVGLREYDDFLTYVHLASRKNIHIEIIKNSWVQYFRIQCHQHEYQNSEVAVNYITTSKDFILGKKQEDVNYVKYFWWWVWTLSRDNARVLLEGLRFANGDETTQESIIYVSSVHFRDNIVRLALHAGYSPYFTLKYTNDETSCGFTNGVTVHHPKHDCWRVSYTSIQHITKPSLHAKEGSIKKVEYVGATWCVSMPSGFVIARRTEKNAEDIVIKASRPVIAGNCPGHAQLIKTIIGGAGIIDMMVLVIDITKGIQTQTAEGLVIGEITTDNMIIVLNKVDRLPTATRDAKIKKAEAGVRRALQKTVFGTAPMVAVAARPGGGKEVKEAKKSTKKKSGAGNKSKTDEVSKDKDSDTSGDKALNMEEFVSLLVSKSKPPSRSSEGPLVFMVDHCFLIKGQGTVMTGTVQSGAVCVGDMIEVPSVGITKKVKSMQMFRKPVKKAIQGDRVGVCVTQFNSKLLERGVVCSPGSVRRIDSCVVSLQRIQYFTSRILGKSKIHITVGHTTVMASTIFFGYVAKSEDGDVKKEFPSAQEATEFDFTLEYKYQEELYADSEEHPSGSQFAFLTFEKPIICPMGSIVIGSRLDTDIYSNKCRLAFHGRLLDVLETDEEEQRKIRVYKKKLKEGVIDRVQDDYTVIGRSMFKKETDFSLFIGLKVRREDNGQLGTIESTFGKTGKFKINFPDGGQKAAGKTRIILEYKTFLWNKEL